MSRWLGRRGNNCHDSRWPKKVQTYSWADRRAPEVSPKHSKLGKWPNSRRGWSPASIDQILSMTFRVEEKRQPVKGALWRLRSQVAMRTGSLETDWIEDLGGTLWAAGGINRPDPWNCRRETGTEAALYLTSGKTEQNSIKWGPQCQCVILTHGIISEPDAELTLMLL